MNLLAAWFRALRAHFLTATVAPLLIGTAAAWAATGRFHLGAFLLATAGVLLIHLGANMSNDYFDYLSETDALNVAGNEFTGGSRVITSGLIPARQILIAAIACLVVGSVAGLYLAWSLRSIPILVLGLLGVFNAYFYTAAPLRLGYRGFGELMNGISFGPIIGLGAWFAQAPAITATGVLASIPPGVLLACLLVVNEVPDHESDRAVGKRTIVVRLGAARALAIFRGVLLVPFAWVAVFTAAGLFSPWTLLAFASFPFALAAWRISRRFAEDPARLVGANRSTFFLHLSFNLLFALGFLIEGL